MRMATKCNQLSCLFIRQMKRKIIPLETIHFPRSSRCYSDLKLETKRTLSSTVGIPDSETPDPSTKFGNNALNFEDYKSALKPKTVSEIARALLVLRLCSFNSIVDHSLQLMTLSEKILGQRAFNILMKGTMYGQFVAGDDPISIKETANKLKQCGIGPMLAIPMEEDVNERCREQRYDSNLAAILDCIRLSAELDHTHPMMQLKVTALLSGDLCAKLSRICPHPCEQPEVLDHITSVIAKPTKCDVKGLTSEENVSLQKALYRFHQIGQSASQYRVIVWVDAEYTYLNPALNLVSLAMMQNFNSDKPLIGYTYQNYLKETYRKLKADLDYISRSGVCFAAKLVRGAYMEKERYLAKDQGYEDPIHPTIRETSMMYNRSMDLMLTNIAANPCRNAVILASHNEETVQRAIQRLSQLEMDPRCGNVFFGQVFGMCDHVSYSLGNQKYLIYKSLPYGPLKETLPYLCRRAQENRSVLQRINRERRLLSKALLERCTTGR